VINRIRKALLPKYRSKLLLDSKYTTDWIADAVRKIAGDQVKAINHG
jgi:hypothetical protein